MEKTMALARQLGKVKYIQLDRRFNAAEYEQELSYLLILDFESTCWKNKASSYPPEIIEFPVVLLNLSTGEIESEFHEYVMPTEHPRLSPFCTELTGISQETVDSGVPLPTCLLLFNKWFARIAEEYKLDKNSKGGLYTCCTWSDWDLNLCLENECKRKQQKKPEPLRNWIDIRAVYKQFYQRKPQGLNGGLRDLGLEFQGREHSGIEDARNTARLVWKMVEDGCRLHQSSGAQRQMAGYPDDQQQDIPHQEVVSTGRQEPVKGSVYAPLQIQDKAGSRPTGSKKYYGNIYPKENMANVQIKAPK